MPKTNFPEEGLLQSVFVFGGAGNNFVNDKGFLENVAHLEFFYPALALGDIAAKIVLHREYLHHRVELAFGQRDIFLQYL